MRSRRYNRFISKVSSSKKVEISSEEAQFLIDNYNKNNRLPKMGQVKKLAREIQNGFWQCNGATIIFDITGNINDGQHRLMACAKSGRSIETWVIVGVPKEFQLTIDQHSKRSMGDSYRLENGNRIPKFQETIINFLACRDNNFSTSLTNSDKKPYFVKYLPIVDSVLEAVPTLLTHRFPNVKRAHKGYRCAIVAAIIEYYEKSPDEAIEFAKGISANEIDVDSSSPIKYYRDNYQAISNGGGARNKSDYLETLWVIHKFHFGMPISPNAGMRQKEGWEF